MVESSYKHNYEYLSIEEVKSIISGTFVQGTTSIGGELATKSDIDKLITAADKRLTSMVPSTAANNEFVCFFECVNNEDFPDDLQHRWIEITPTNAGNFPETGGTINVTGSYGLTGSLGTRKVVGYINDTITVGRNTTTSTKSGSKTYYYNNNSGTAPSATVTWTQDAHIEQFTYEYEFKIGLTKDDITHNQIDIQFSANEYEKSSSKAIYFKSVKNKINESGDVVNSENVKISTQGTYNNHFVESISNDQNVIYIYPESKNTSYRDAITTGIVFTNGQSDKKIDCKINVFHMANEMKFFYNDAFKLTVSWDSSQGKDLDTAVYADLNDSKLDYNQNYVGGRESFVNQRQRTYLFTSGDENKSGAEEIFVDMARISEWLKIHGSEKSKIDGKTILESLTDNNNVVSIKIPIYCNWYGQKIGENATLTITQYNCDSDNRKVEVRNKKIVLTGYSEISSNDYKVYCFAGDKKSNINYGGMTNGTSYYRLDSYTQVAELTYYVNDSNDGYYTISTNYYDPNDFQKGYTWGDEPHVSVSEKNVSVSGQTINVDYAIDFSNTEAKDYNGTIRSFLSLQNKNGGVLYTNSHHNENVAKGDSPCYSYKNENGLFYFNKKIQFSQLDGIDGDGFDGDVYVRFVEYWWDIKKQAYHAEWQLLDVVNIK